MTQSPPAGIAAGHARPLVATGRYSLVVANTPADVDDVQRLRYRVFAEELGARLHGSRPGRDVDEFDEFCDHLLIRECATGEAVSTYRMLPPDRATRAGRLYSETNFDLTALDPLRPALVEAGRACVHPEHRTGTVVGLMWAGIARYMFHSGHRYLAGCATVPLGDGGGQAAGVWDLVRAKHYAPDEHRVHPRREWQVEDITRHTRIAVPPLLKGYLRLGARVCGRPAHDPDFDGADLFVLLSLAHVDQRYLRFFLGEPA
ncbi:GNAT family N-acetyltransferase [Saccharothrix stipae]